ncbi:MAG TPA: monovalent cation/H(+) antiporter subunit G [Vulgatibacter sp.]
MSWLGGALTVIGLLLALVGVVGMLRLEDVYLRVQAASLGSLGVTAILLASVATGDGGIIARALLVATFLVVSTPVATHAVARAAWQRREKLLSKEGWDETGRLADPPR